MRVITADQIRATVRLEDLIEPVAEAFKAYSRGDSSDGITHLHPNGGEVHIKAGFIRGSRIFAVKVSAGFAGNTARGLPIWDGAVMAFDAETGVPVAVLQEGGILTDWRTAAAGAIATRALARETRTLGVVGTGLQAYWQPLAHRAVLEFETLLIWGRDAARAHELRTKLLPELKGVTIEVLENLETLVRRSDAIITTTSSREPLIRADWLRDDQHITAVGADDDQKCELEPAILHRAELVVVDSIPVNLKYGDVARAGLDESKLLELGALLEQPRALRGPTIAKLVGLGVQDLAAVQAVLERYNQ
jgi:ornithine cyclodeaminase/alanine dehydrogenase-like protein (mu-crystallin family)